MKHPLQMFRSLPLYLYIRMLLVGATPPVPVCLPEIKCVTLVAGTKLYFFLDLKYKSILLSQKVNIEMAMNL